MNIEELKAKVDDLNKEFEAEDIRHRDIYIQA